MASIYDWSSTAASNATADADLTWAEGQNPNTVNDSARQMMKRVRDTLTDIAGVTLVTGTANGLLLTAANAFTTLATGRIVSFRAASSNTAASTLNVNGIGAKSIRYMTTAGDVAIPAGMITEHGVYVAIYGAQFNSSAGGWMLVNPTADFGAMVTLTGTQTLTNKTITIRDDNLSITGSSDATKVIQFQVDGLTTATTRTITVPDSDLTLVGTTTTQTLTNKTLTSPTITGLAASSAAAGLVELATNGEAQAGSSTSLAITPANLHSAVGSATSGLALGALGTYALLRRPGGVVTTPGTVVAGSALVYASADGNSSGVAPSGSWMCVSYLADVGAASQTGLFLRTS